MKMLVPRLNYLRSLAQARTGTGKTLAFLIPMVQNILSREPILADRNHRAYARADDTQALIISPTRELAEQIAEAARRLVTNTKIQVRTAVGGTQKRIGLQRIQEGGCHILVGTPGRLIDILSDPASGVRLPKLNTLVLDEADRLLDDGFYPAIKEIGQHLPSTQSVDRQTLLYSATVPREVMGMVQETLKPNYKFIKTVKEGELQTHQKVAQKVVSVRAYQNALPALVELCSKALTESTETPFKAIVFFSATAEAALAYEVFSCLRGGLSSNSPFSNTQIIQIHAKLSQRQRTYAAEAFRRATSSILFSSDVTARGMDFPNVTHVIQIGLPPTEEQYVHRLGRTARADRSGEGWLILPPHDADEARSKLRKMPLRVDKSLETATVDMTEQSEMPASVAKILTEAGDACRRVPYHIKAAAYKSNLGLMSWMGDKQKIIDTLNERAIFGWGMETPPKVSPVLVSKLNLTRVRGLEIGHDEERPPHFGSPDGRRDGPRRFDGGGRRFEGGSSRYEGGGGRRFEGDGRRSDGGGRRFEGGGRRFEGDDRRQGYGNRQNDYSRPARDSGRY